VLPNAELRELDGTHSFRLEVLAPVLADFFAADSPGLATSAGAVRAA
jgi:hypothetical protein